MNQPSRNKHRAAWPWLAAATLLIYCVSRYSNNSGSANLGTAPQPAQAQAILARCATLNDIPVAPTERRVSSDRFVDETKPYLIRNATIWTGEDNGRDVVRGDILIDKGLIQAIGRVPNTLLDERRGLVILEANGAWLTPGIVDMHSHMGDEPAPALSGANDANSIHGPITSWMRSLDALNTRDDSYRLSVAGGITTALILPGSANAIGGEAFTIKIRPTAERTPSSMLVDGPPEANGTTGVPLRWRHMKHACGENPARMYGDTRMDSVWKTRQAYEEARQIKEAQDDYCEAAIQGRWDLVQGKPFPEELQWESLVAILRGRVKVQTHCYEATDITNFVRISNEFRFPIAAFHHAHEAYLVPSVLRSAYGGTPTIAQFGSFSRYKREAYRHSHYAPRLLADEGIPVVMKSDHPAISRSLLHEAQQAHYHGLPEHLALASVTTVPANTTGLNWRLGAIRTGLDADIVLWDSHPLTLGATPMQVFIDGIPQLEERPLVSKGARLQHAPVTPNFDQEAQLALKHEGLPPLEPSSHIEHTVVFTNLTSVFTVNPDTKKIVRSLSALDTDPGPTMVVVEAGRIVCITLYEAKCRRYIERANLVTYIDLARGSIGPGFVAAGTGLGLAEIAMEPSTTDGTVFDPLHGPVPAIVGGEDSIIRAVDGLMFGTRDSLLAYRAGVVASISAPESDGLLSGLSVAFSPGASSSLRKGAVLQNVAAVHVTISMGSPISISTQIAALRRLLSSSLHGRSQLRVGERTYWFNQVTSGKIPLVIYVHSADVMATLIELKKEIELESGESMRMTFAGAAEAHLLAEELASSRIGVLLTPPRAFPGTWEQRRILAGPPLTPESGVTKLFRHNVSLAIGPQGLIPAAGGTMSNWAVQNLRWDAGWVAIESNGTIKEEDALALASTNVAELLGVKVDTDLVAVRGGGLLDFQGRVVAVISKEKSLVDTLM